MANKLKALVVDDSAVMRKMVMEHAKRTGLAEFEFIEAENGEDALAKLTEEIKVAFVDWNMPKMTGVEFVRKVRSQPGGHKLILIMVTSEKGISKSKEAMGDAGADGFVSKPFTHRDLAYELKPLLEKKAAEEAALAS
jgi:two-component system chemotaxis response regulator CheY